MRPVALQTPGPALGPYPERAADDDDTPQRSSGSPIPGPLAQRREQRFLARVDALAGSTRALSGVAFNARAREVRLQLVTDGFSDEAMASAFSLVREATRRTLGLTQFSTQLVAARIMLGNQLAEMATGEGKTLAAAVVAGTAALAPMQRSFAYRYGSLGRPRS